MKRGEDERGREAQAQAVSDSAWERRTGEGWKSGAPSWLLLDFLRVGTPGVQDTALFWNGPVQLQRGRPFRVAECHVTKGWTVFCLLRSPIRPLAIATSFFLRAAGGGGALTDWLGSVARRS